MVHPGAHRGVRAHRARAAFIERCALNKPPAALLALDGRELASLTTAERALLHRYRKGIYRKGIRRGALRLPWVLVSFQCSSLNFDPWEWLRASRRADRDTVLRQAGAVVRIRVYD